MENFEILPSRLQQYGMGHGALHRLLRDNVEPTPDDLYIHVDATIWSEEEADDPYLYPIWMTRKDVTNYYSSGGSGHFAEPKGFAQRIRNLCEFSYMELEDGHC